MSKDTVLYIVIAVVAGYLLGAYVTKQRLTHTTEGLTAPAATVPATAVPMPPPTGAAAAPVGDMIQHLAQTAPQDRDGWVQLGNSYFDSNQPAAAVEAYDRALELQPADANVLTDQGVMYRRMGEFDRAVENFAQASLLDPTHRQSLYNLGIVYQHDLQDAAKAREAWNRYLELNSDGPQAASVRQELELLDQATR